MTKDEFCKYVPIAFHDNYLGDCMRVPNIIDALNEYFVCIPKGDNRHPYADVYHAIAEGKECQWKDPDGSNVWNDYIVGQGIEFRIKSQEPVYEWQWLAHDTDGIYFLTQGYYMELEIKEIKTLSSDIYLYKIEETKRERK